MTSPSNDTQALRFPIGEFEHVGPASPAARAEMIERIETLPVRFAAVIARLPTRAYDLPYRPGGWSVRQLAHHLADSHLNGYTRWRLALTEDTPVIKPYDQDLWAQLPDVASVDPEQSLFILRGLHARWTALIRGTTSEQLSRCYVNPESGRPTSLHLALALYAWHGEHHLAHAQLVRVEATR